MTSTSLKGEQPITALHDIVDHVIIACCVVIGRCNKVQCTVCGTNMCWLCGKAISGYDHFNSANAKCILFDTLDGDHHWYNPRPPYNPNANREAPVVSLTPFFKFYLHMVGCLLIFRGCRSTSGLCKRWRWTRPRVATFSSVLAVACRTCAVRRTTTCDAGTVAVTSVSSVKLSSVASLLNTSTLHNPVTNTPQPSDVTCTTLQPTLHNQVTSHFTTPQPTLHNQVTSRYIFNPVTTVYYLFISVILQNI